MTTTPITPSTTTPTTPPTTTVTIRPNTTPARTPRRRSTLPATVLATLAAIALTGCAIGGRAGHTARATPEARFLDIAGKQAEYATTVTHFPYELPDGIAFPARVQHPAERVMFQEGAGLVEAFQFWECAWMDQAISAQPAGQPAVDVALAWLELGTASEYRTRYMDDPADIWGRQVLAPAKQGDLRVLEEFFDGCTSYRAATGR